MTPHELTDAVIDLASGGYGESAAAVVATGKRLADIQAKTNPSDFRVFRDEVSWHPKVFSKVLTIGKDKRLETHIKDLPDSYSAIYAFALLNDEEFAVAVNEGILNPSASVRFINDWAKTHRLHGNAVVDEISLVMTAKKSLGEEKTKELITALKNTCASYGATLRVGSGNTREVIAEERDSIADTLLAELSKRMDVVVKSADPQLVQEFALRSGSELANAEMRSFTGFLVKSTGSSSAMWQQHGDDYCKKVSMEFNRTDSKAQRFNYKKRLMEVKEKHPSLGATVDDCLERYCR